MIGKKLYKELVIKIIERKLCDYKKNIEDTYIAVTSNDKAEWIYLLIHNLATKFKNVNIVTNNINYFKYLQEKLYEENGAVIAITNNKKKALQKVDVIFNIDFTEDQLNKYRINDECLIISLDEKVIIHKKRFSGKIISDYEIKLKYDSKIYNDLIQPKYKKYDLKDLSFCYLINNPEEEKNIIICN